MHILRALSSLALFAGTFAQAQYLQDELSFGHSGRISADAHGIPNFKIDGLPTPPSILSDRIILTPVSPGSHRGSIWSDKPLNHIEWTVDVDFRAAGQGRVGGNLQIWLVKDGEQDVRMSSIYTVGTFDGLALVVDTYTGPGGTVRGFLNDGLSNYKNHHSVDSLAFGHCEHLYRNLGRPTQIKLKQTLGGFSVTLDGVMCFESPKIRIPKGYYLGVTAASTEDPDSFEIFKLVVTTTNQGPGSEAPKDGDYRKEQPIQHSNIYVGSQEDLPEQSAEAISQEKQFADLHYRLQALMKHISMFQREFQLYQREADRRHEEIKSGRVLPNDQLAALNVRMETLERNIDQIKRAVGEVDYSKHIDDLKRTIGEHHSTLLEGMTGSVGQLITGSKPRLGFLIFIILGSQFLLVLSYVIYKRRRALAPKKYL